jgi:uncharacterized protein (TIRG00374 family)
LALGRTAKQALGIAGVVLISFLALTIALGSPSRLLEELKGISLRDLAVSVILLFLVEVVKAVRLCILADKGLEALRACLLARLLGRAAASITPAGLGGLPTRTAVLASEARIELGKAFGASSGETLSDNSVAIIILLVGALLGVMNPVVLALAVLIAVLWAAGIFVGVHERTMNALYRMLRISEKRRCGLERERKAALEALGILLKPGKALAVYALTLLAHTLEYLSVIVFTGAWLSCEAWLHSMMAVEAGYMMIFTPAPGGGGGVEYALVSYIGARLALYWRLSYLIAALSPLALAYIVYPSLRDYIGGYELEEACSE